MDEQTIERIAERVADNKYNWTQSPHAWQLAYEMVVDSIKQEIITPTPTRPTVQLRIPAIVRSDAKWAAQGCDATNLQDQEIWYKNMAGDLLPPRHTASERRIIITANVELPEDAVEVEGKTEEPSDG